MKPQGDLLIGGLVIFLDAAQSNGNRREKKEMRTESCQESQRDHTSCYSHLLSHSCMPGAEALTPCAFQDGGHSVL